MLSQVKLCREEWAALEIPVQESEMEILTFIQHAAKEKIHLKSNKHLSILGYLNFGSVESDVMDFFLFDTYMKKRVEDIVETLYKWNSAHKLEIPKYTGATIVRLNSADSIRFKNANLSKGFSKCYEFVLLEHIEAIVADKKDKKKQMFHYYTLQQLLKNSVLKLNRAFMQFCRAFSRYFEVDWLKMQFVRYAADFIERNAILMQYQDLELYDHQKELFSICNIGFVHPAKLILYKAPTGTGKTMAPIGLVSSGHIVLFLCAARHVGLALARAAVSLHQKVAFAFGCTGSMDIRLHYFAAVGYNKNNNNNNNNNNSKKVNNADGRNVQLMICDLVSFEIAMKYMETFHAVSQMVFFWDDVTISLEEESHAFHPLMTHVWRVNAIPTVILASATLPDKEDIGLVIADFESRFEEARTHSIVADDCKKSITLLNKHGACLVPHCYSADKEILLQMVQHCEVHSTLLRYIDLEEIVAFLFTPQIYDTFGAEFCETFFSSIADITMVSIKKLYLKILKNAISEPFWPTLCATLSPSKRIPNGGVYLTTSDAVTLTDGPTIFICDDVATIASFCIQQAKIPTEGIKAILKQLEINAMMQEKIEEEEAKLQFLETQQPQGGFSKKNSRDENSEKSENNNNNNNNVTAQIRRVTEEIGNLRAWLVTAHLSNLYIPNKREHLEKWASVAPQALTKAAFTSNVPEAYVREIMGLSGICNDWKILLLMGIGVYSAETVKETAYLELIKKLADNQQLFLSIGTKEFIWGLNYQYCHGYIGKGLSLTPQQLLQALGRVGRGNVQQTYSVRFRDGDDARILATIFSPDNDRREALKMSVLFNVQNLRWDINGQMFIIS